MPLVRKLDASGAGSSWLEVVQQRAFVPKTPCTELEKDAGISYSIYFFFGCAAYPGGNVAIVLNSEIAGLTDCSFWPFDTGALVSHMVTRDGSELDTEARERAFHGHWGKGDALPKFAGLFIAAHFKDPVNYLRRPQKGSPDFPVYHGLASRDDDRRSWTIEVQVHASISLTRESGYLKSIMLQRHQLLSELPDDLVEYAKVANDVNFAVRELLDSLCAMEAP